MYKRLVTFLEKNHVIFQGQFGFHSSTTHAILLIVDKIQKAIENKMYSCGILILDLSKAFVNRYCKSYNITKKNLKIVE